jgi:hypothetical protein
MLGKGLLVAGKEDETEKAVPGGSHKFIWACATRIDDALAERLGRRDIIMALHLPGSTSTFCDRPYRTPIAATSAAVLHLSEFHEHRQPNIWSGTHDSASPRLTHSPVCPFSILKSIRDSKLIVCEARSDPA